MSGVLGFVVGLVVLGSVQVQGAEEKPDPFIEFARDARAAADALTAEADADAAPEAVAAARVLLEGRVGELTVGASDDSFVARPWVEREVARLLDPGTEVATLAAGLRSLAVLAESEPLERELLERADRSIEKLRKSDVTVRVVDGDGQAVAGVAVEVRQTGSEFLFGGNIYLFGRIDEPSLQKSYDERFAELFNYATTDFYWKRYERERGLVAPSYAYTDRVASWCRERGIRLKGHPILWSHHSHRPDWLRDAPSVELQKYRVQQLMPRFAGAIQAWEVVNEPAHTDHPIDDAYRWARAADPAAELIVNDYQVLGDGYEKFFELLRGAIERDVPIDGIGIQGHFPLHERFPLEDVWGVLERYATLGKPLHLTELTPCSAGQEIVGSPLEGRWDELTQADYARKLYRVAFAHPAVVAITWWDLADLEPWQEGGGLLHADMTPKPAYEALSALILERWRTRERGETDAQGRFQFRGFHGSYEVRAAAASATGRVRKGGLNMIRVVVADKQ